MNEPESHDANPSPPWTRRRVLSAAGKVLALGAIESVAPVAMAAMDPPRKLSDLENYRLTGHDGNPVKISDVLKDQVTGHDATLTFGFAECTQYCPFINGVLAALDKKAPGRFRHIVIATNPNDNNVFKGDNRDQNARNNFKQMIRMMMGEPEPAKGQDNLIILYPPDHATAVRIQRDFDNIVGDDIKTHTANVSVFGKTGQRIAKIVPPEVPTKEQNGADYLEKKAQEFADQVLVKMNGRGVL